MGDAMPENMMLTINGKPHPYRKGMTIASLLAETMGGSATVVVEVNGVIILREKFGETALHADDSLEVVHFVGGR